MEDVVLLTLMYSVTLSSCSYPRFHDDYKVSKIQLPAVFQDYAEKLLEVSVDMPRPCRKDICYAGKNESETKGEFLWPEILVAQKVELRCPFSFEVPVYSTRVCGLNYQGDAEWQEPDFENVCPDPPLTVLLRQFNEEVSAPKPRVYIYNITEDIVMYTSFINKVVDVFTKYRGTPMNNDIPDLVEYYFNAATILLVEQAGPVSMTLGKNMLYILNALMEKDLKWDLYGSLHGTNGNKLANLVQYLPSKLEVPTHDYPVEIIFSNLALYVMNISKDTQGQLNITKGFTSVLSSGDTVYTPRVSIDLEQVDMKGDPVIIGVVIVKEATILSYEYTWMTLEENNYLNLFGSQYNYDNNYPSYYHQFDTGSGEYYVEETTTDINVQFQYRNNLTYGTTTQHVGQVGTTEPTTTYEEESSFLFPSEVKNFDKLGAVIYLTSLSENYFVTNDISIVYEVHTCENKSNCQDNVACVASNHEDKYSYWTDQECKTLDNQSKNGYITCQCSGLGSFSVFAESDIVYQDVPSIPNIEEKIIVGQGDISSFVGFPYRKELDILGNVLGVISLACLVATVASYSIFRRTRSGSPTVVLLNLCVALIALSVLLFSIYIAGKSMTMTGCTVSNTLRYYLVFVTLVWNGVEGFNMYLMIVRVFHSNVSKFGLKAGIIAWGLPAVMVSICYGVSKKAFDGKHVLISEKLQQCIFQCQLRNKTLYYGYLLPMSAIIIHNLVIFGFVLNAILKNGSKLGKVKKNNKLVQLLGAIATLVLLGVPWMFSAFGAIDAVENSHLEWTEGVFQVVFVVFVNLQGVFIFIFHCIRNAQIRMSWSNVVKRSSFKRSQSTVVSSVPDSAMSVRSKKESQQVATKDFDNI